MLPLAIERPANQEFIDYFRKVWNSLIASGDLNSNPEHILDMTLGTILGGNSLGDCINVWDMFKDWEVIAYDIMGFPLTKELFRTAVYLKYDICLQG